MTKVDIALPGQAGADALALPVAQPVGGGGARIVDEKAPSLDEIFVAQVGTKHDAPLEE